jgi:hypothetical protein
VDVLSEAWISNWPALSDRYRLEGSELARTTRLSLTVRHVLNVRAPEPARPSASQYPAPEQGLPDGLSSEWLTGLLRHHNHISDATVLRIVCVTDIYEHNGVIFRIAATYHGKDTDLPATFVLKLTPEELGLSGKREALFYNELACKVPFGGDLTAPRSYWAATGVRRRCEWRPDGIVSVPDSVRPDLEASTDESSTAILMADVGEHDFNAIYDRFPAPSPGNIFLAEAKLILQRLALVHGAWWGRADALCAHELLAAPRRCNSELSYASLLADPRCAQVQPCLEPFPALAQLYAKEIAHSGLDSAPWTLLHGDVCAANVLVSGTSVCFFDWAEVNVGRAAVELERFTWRSNFYDSEGTLLHGRSGRRGPRVTSSAVVCELLRAYHSELVHHGVDVAAYPWETLVEHYVVASMLEAMAEVVEAAESATDLTEVASQMRPRYALLQSLCTQLLQ